ncbi:unnamed protein product [Angiostrongylus costaricensis]|uniref:Ion_trans_2 domain-containing protein n=1 Tax=Angiostrongylus costaricensis TaxID=334426 RepID=A0A0R3PEB5_ANGCS|nr:unnamed protein product [Angiostrongylus costaricensis]
MVAIRKAALEEAILNIAKQMTMVINDPEQTITVQTMAAYVKNTYKTLLQQEAAYVGSTFYKDEDPNNHMMWTFGSSFFFSMNVFTTTGYGRKIRSKHDIEEGEMFTLPVLLCMVIMFAYLMGTTTFIFIYDKLSGPPETGIDYFLSFYFSFISISTIGLGDVMPNNVTFDPLITILFFFGMPLMKVVNSSTYQCVEKSTIGILTFFENRLLQISQGSRIPVTLNESTKPCSITLTDTNSSALKEDPQNDIAIRSMLTFIKSDAHVYDHHFGRVNLTTRTDAL